MFLIFAQTEYVADVQRILGLDSTLANFVDVVNVEDVSSLSDGILLVDEQEIHIMLDWTNIRAPYLLKSPLPFEEEVLLDVLAIIMGRWERFEDLSPDSHLLYRDIIALKSLETHEMISWDTLASIIEQKDEEDLFNKYRFYHNRAILLNYALTNQDIDLEEISLAYREALYSAPNEEYSAFTVRHYAMFLAEMDDMAEAEAILDQTLDLELSDEATFALYALKAKIKLQRLNFPYNKGEVDELKKLLWDTLEYYEEENRFLDVAMLLMDTAQVASITHDFSESLGYIQRAINIFEEEGLEELKGNALAVMGRLMYMWAQNGHPRFYDSAIASYQKALTIFSKEHAPAVFAEIHHNLGVLYAEKPGDDTQRKSWAEVSASAFKEALSFFTKDKAPYEYGMVCNNYGNALTKYPSSQPRENIERALDYYRASLSVRDPQEFPYERALTILNLLDASWEAPNPESLILERWEEMVQRAEEVVELVEDTQLLDQAHMHLKKLEELKH